MILFVKLLIAHIIGDVYLKLPWFKVKNQNSKFKSFKPYLHVLIHCTLMLLILQDFKYWQGISFILITHLVIELWKDHNKKAKNKTVILISGQIFHITVIIIASDWYDPFVQQIAQGVNSNHFYLFALAILLITKVSSILIKAIISKWAPENEDNEEDSLSKAGSYIGMLERLFVFGFIVIGNIQLIGFLLAAKSVFRFGDLKDAVDRKLTEYILIGTLLSFGLAIILGLGYMKVIELF